MPTLYWEGLGQEEKGTTEDEMAGWHHRLDGLEFGCQELRLAFSVISAPQDTQKA